MPGTAGGAASLTLEVGDLNSDGYGDLVLLRNPNTIDAHIHYNDGSDDLAPPVIIDPNPQSSISTRNGAIGDFDGDGRNDLALPNDLTHLSLYRQTSTGELTPAGVIDSRLFPDVLFSADVDSDSNDDLIVQHSGSGGVGIYLHDAGWLSNEIFFPAPSPSNYADHALASGDINGDHCQDVVVASREHGLIVHAGRNCELNADIAPSLGMTPTVPALRIDNYGNAAAENVQSVLDLSVRSGSLSIGQLPAQCSVEKQQSQSARLVCNQGTLPADSSLTALIPISIQSVNTPSNTLTVNVTATTSSREVRTVNNATLGRLVLGSSVSSLSTWQKIRP